MGIGSMILKYFGYRKRYFFFFRKLFELGVMGMGYGRLTRDDLQEDYVLSLLNEKFHYKYLVVIDVGANKGNFLRNIINRIEFGHLKYFGFEPNKDLHPTINGLVDSRNIEVNLFSEAISDREGTFEFFKNNKDVCSGFYSSQNGGTSINVETITIDSFVSKEKLPKIDILKIDTEGHDFFVLRGGTNTLRSGLVSIIFFEFSENVVKSRSYFFDIWALLSTNFKLYFILKDGLLEITEYKALYLEILYFNNFLAINRELKIDL